MPAGGMNSRSAREAKERREALIKHINRGMDLKTAIKAAGWSSPSAYWKNRSNWKDWAAQVDLALNRQVQAMNPEGAHSVEWDSKTMGFLQFREIFLGRKSPWFHLLAIQAMDELPPGAILHILWPPEHGKTALWEDADTFWICQDPNVRITVGSERRTQAGKVTGFVRARLENDAEGMAKMRERFGPFAPIKGRAGADQAWGRYEFNVAKKRLTGERDFTMQAVGMTGSVIGSRCDKMQVDDPQGRKSHLKMNNAATLLDTFRQDWLSRPGEEGTCTVLANRVGEGDFHELLQLADIVDRTIIVPAWNPDNGGWAWREKYTPEQYQRMRKKVGPDAWDRNYMQRDFGTKDVTFVKDVHWGPCLNTLRSIRHHPTRPTGAKNPTQIAITLDPGFTRAGIAAGALLPDKLELLDAHGVLHAKAYGNFGEMIEELCLRYHVPGESVISDLIIESKAFQKGLLEDEKIVELQARYGFEITGFETGINKYDPDIGIPQMARSMVRQEIDIPAFDQASVDAFDDLWQEMRTWRAGIKGNKLQQDVLMTVWFLWHKWRTIRRTVAYDPGAWNFRR